MSAESNAELVATYKQFLDGSYANYAVTALVFYEYLIIFKYQVDFIWRRKWSAATWIFVVNQYILLGNVISGVIPYNAQWSITDSTHDLKSVVLAAVTLPAHAFTILRIFALLRDSSWRLVVTWTLFILALISFIRDTYAGFTMLWFYTEEPLLGSACYQDGFSAPPNALNRFTIATSVLGIVSEAFVLVITLLKTAQQVRQASMLGFGTTLSKILLRDGSLFFLITLIGDIINTMNGTVLTGPADYVITPFLNVIVYILLSRFIINLRQVDSPDTSSFANMSYFSTPNFRMPTMDEVVGNLGEPLDFSEHHLNDENASDDSTAATYQQDEDSGITCNNNMLSIDGEQPESRPSPVLSV